MLQFIVKRVLIIVIILVNSLNGHSQTVTFNERLSLGYPNTVFTGVEVTDTCYYVSGIVAPTSISPTAALIVKFDTLGNEVSHSIYQNAETWEAYLHTTINGNLEVAPYVYDSIGMHGAIYTYDTDGNLIGSKFYDNPWTVGGYIRPDDMQLLSDTGHIIATIVNDTNGIADLYILKLDPQGQIDWGVTRSGASIMAEHDPCIILDTDSTYVLGYQQSNITGSPNTSTIKSYVERLDPSGNTLWQYQSPNNQQIHGVNDLVQTKDSGFVAASAWGYERMIGSGNVVYYHHAYLYKLDQNGQLVWDRIFYTFNYNDRVEFTKVLELPDSSLVAWGRMSEVGTDVVVGRMVKVSPRGDSLWNRTYEYLTVAGDYHTIYDVEVTPDGGFLVVGEANGGSSGVFQQGWLLKLDEHGCLVPGCHLVSSTEPAPQEKLSLELYPNPCQQYLNVYYPLVSHLGKLQWRLLDLQGRVVQEYQRSDEGAKTYIFEVSDLLSGVYILELKRDGRLLAAQEFIKQ